MSSLGDIVAPPNIVHKNKHREFAKISRQRNMAHMKRQNKTPEKELNKMEKSNLSDAEFEILVKSLLKDLSKDFNSIKKIQSETKDILTEIKNNLQGNSKSG